MLVDKNTRKVEVVDTRIEGSNLRRDEKQAVEIVWNIFEAILTKEDQSEKSFFLS